MIEALYHCIRAHEEVMAEKRATRPGYDDSWAAENLDTARSLLERAMTNAGIGGDRRALAIAAWDRGLQPDVIEAVRAGLGQRFVASGQPSEQIRAFLKLFFVDREYQTSDGLVFYGGASLCLHWAQSIGLDPNQLVGELAEEMANEQDAASEGVK